MTLNSNARIAGSTFLLYILIGVAGMVLFTKATAGSDVTVRLANSLQHDLQLRFTALFGVLETICAMVLGVTLYALTRAVDAEVALLGLAFRLGEGFLGAVQTRRTLDLLWLVGSTGTAPSATVQALGPYLFNGSGWNMGAFFFAVGSSLFCYLLLRGRIIPLPLAWIGVLASVLLVAGLPLQLLGVVHGLGASLIWIPMAAFEIPLGFWWLIKGVGTNPITRS